MWERGRYVEYLLAFSFFKRVQDHYGKPLISSGCFSVYRTDGAARARRLVDADDGRGHGPDLDASTRPGSKVRFLPEAVSYPIEPHDFDFMGKQLRRWSHGFVQNVRLHWRGLLELGYLRSTVAVAFWDALLASLAYLVLLPVLAVAIDPLILVGLSDRRAGRAGPGALAGGRAPRGPARARELAGASSSCAIVNGVFMLRALWRRVRRCGGRCSSTRRGTDVRRTPGARPRRPLLHPLGAAGAVRSSCGRTVRGQAARRWGGRSGGSSPSRSRWSSRSTSPCASSTHCWRLPTLHDDRSADSMTALPLLPIGITAALLAIVLLTAKGMQLASRLPVGPLTMPRIWPSRPRLLAGTATLFAAWFALLFLGASQLSTLSGEGGGSGHDAPSEEVVTGGGEAAPGSLRGDSVPGSASAEPAADLGPSPGQTDQSSAGAGVDVDLQAASRGAPGPARAFRRRRHTPEAHQFSRWPGQRPSPRPGPGGRRTPGYGRTLRRCRSPARAKLPRAPDGPRAPGPRTPPAGRRSPAVSPRSGRAPGRPSHRWGIRSLVAADRDEDVAQLSLAADVPVEADLQPGRHRCRPQPGDLGADAEPLRRKAPAPDIEGSPRRRRCRPRPRSSHRMVRSPAATARSSRCRSRRGGWRRRGRPAGRSRRSGRGPCAESGEPSRACILGRCLRLPARHPRRGAGLRRCSFGSGGSSVGDDPVRRARSRRRRLPSLALGGADRCGAVPASLACRPASTCGWRRSSASPWRR